MKSLIVGRFVASFVFVISFLSFSHAGFAQQNPSDYTVGHRYDLAGRETGTILPDPDGAGTRLYKATRNTFNGIGQLKIVETGYLQAWQPESVAPANWSGFIIETSQDLTYDSWGRKTTEKLSALGVSYSLVQYSYDSVGRVDCKAIRMNPNAYTSIPSSACSLGAQGQYGNDRITKYKYDQYSQILEVRNALNTSLEQAHATYTYKVVGLRDSVKDANGNYTKYEFDNFGRVSKTYFPSKTQPGQYSSSDYESYTYDDNNNQKSLRKRDGQVISYFYDGLNRVYFKDIAGTADDVWYGYNNMGLQTYAKFVSSSGLGITNNYDGFGALVTSTNTMGGYTRTLSYEYDLNGNRSRLTFPDGKYFYFTFDGINSVSALRENSTTATPIINFDYYNSTSLKEIGFSGGAKNAYTYNEINQLKTATQDLSGTTNDLTNTFGYNPAGQIISRNVSNSAYLYGENKNIIGNYAVNGLNQYTGAGGKTFSYDNNGNLTSDGYTTFSYDTENRLKTAAGAKSASLTYDPMGRLFQLTSNGVTTQFLYDGDSLVAEYNSSNSLLRRYVHGSRVDEPLLWYEGSAVGSANRRYLQADHQGSIVAVSNSSAGLIAKNTYDVYGIPGANNQGRFSYTGQIYLPELGLYYYKARIYSPVLGRFLQTDPVGYKDQINLYAYVGNDPVNRVDPTGKFWWFFAALFLEGGTATTTAAVTTAAVTTTATVTATDVAIAGAVVYSAANAAHVQQGLTSLNSESSGEKDAPVSGAKHTGRSERYDQDHWEKEGGLEEATKDAESDLGVKNLKPTKNGQKGTKTGTTPDGRKVTVRPYHNPEEAIATIDIAPPEGGRPTDKIRYK